MDRDRARRAILGAFVADAASLGTHWVYRPDAMAKAVPSMEAPEFKDPPEPKFYSAAEFPGHYAAGALSPYGEQLLFVTEYCASTGDIEGQRASEAMAAWAAAYTGRKDHATLDFAANMEKADGSGKWPACGADDDQAHCYMKVVPVTVMYAGKPECAAKVAECIRVHQNNDRAVAFGLAASRILEAVLLGASLEDALRSAIGAARAENRSGNAAVIETFELVKQHIEMPLNDFLTQLSHDMMKDKPDSPMFEIAAITCAFPGAFAGPVHQLYKAATADSSTDRYVDAIRANILASGDTCSRAVFLGAVLAASAGGPPEAWVGKLTSGLERIGAAADAIIGHHAGPAA